MRRRLFRYEQKTLPRVVGAGAVIAAAAPGSAASIPFSVPALHVSDEAHGAATGNALVRLEDRNVSACFHSTGSVTEIVVDGFYYRLTHQEFKGEAGNREGAAELRAEIPGKIIKLLVSEGDIVEADAPLLIQEAMKMEMTLKAPARSRVKEVLVSAGAQVDADAVLMRFEAVRE